jgi:hypothetical protein
MIIYKGKNKRPPTQIARKAWVEFHGRPIPKDETGRSYDIHHIDGDPWNNSKENLVALHIKVHYETHFVQEDWNACKLIAKRMKMPPELISELARKAINKQVAEGKHPLQQQKNKDKISKIAKERELKKASGGVHPWQRQEHIEMLAEKTKERNAKRVADGTHPFIGGEMQRNNMNKRIAEGKHNLAGGVTCRDKEGNVVQVPKEVYNKQKKVTKDKVYWEFVQVNSNEAKQRKERQVND